MCFSLEGERVVCISRFVLEYDSPVDGYLELILKMRETNS